MNVSRSKDFRVGFRIESWDLERLAQLLGGYEVVKGLAVEMADGSSYQLESVAELKEVKNVQGRRITAVSMESASPAFLPGEDQQARLALVTVREGASDTVRYHVSGPARGVARLSSELDDWVASLRPWFSSLAVMDRPRFFIWSAVPIATLALLVTALYLALGSGSVLGESWPPGRLASIVTGAGLLALVAVTAGMNVRRHGFFPVADFRIGQVSENSGRVDRRRARLLRASVGAAMLAIGGSIAGAFLG